MRSATIKTTFGASLTIVGVIMFLPACVDAAALPYYSWISHVFDLEKGNVFTAVMVFGALFFWLFLRAKRGRKLFLRTIPGLKALEEAVGRATEMGKPVLFVPGIDDIDEIQTLAGLIVLGHVAHITAQYDSPLIVACRYPVAMSVAEESVRQAHIAVGRPDTYQADNIRYLSGDQFAFTAAVDGIMLREKPAANIYLGSFYAESLILSETGYSTGAIQIAGTANAAQLPFFIAACDYTMIGEEFYAASAYLSQDPPILASIKTSDYFKVFVLLMLMLGIVFATVAPEALALLKIFF
jgi:hypothetical protein